jgi:urocanate hydratase
MGEGQMWNSLSERFELASEVLAAHNIEPVQLAAKEGLAMINGTQLIASLGAEALVRSRLLAVQSDVVAGVTMEALRARPDAFEEIVHALRGQQGQVDVAERLRLIMHSAVDRSEIYEHSPHNVQDAYSIRCTPSVHGIVHDTIEFVETIITRELNAATDNPLVLEDGRVVSAGNFHGEPAGKVLDYLAIGVSELATIAERRIERMLNESLSGPTLARDADAADSSSSTANRFHLPPFLMPRSSGGLNSGFMIPHCTAAALVSENKVHCHPASCDSISTSAAQEDHVSMATFAAIKLLRVVENVERVLSIELLAACQALDLVEPANMKSTSRVEAVRSLVRLRVPMWKQDRVAADDMAVTFEMIQTGAVLRAAAVTLHRGNGGWDASGGNAFYTPLIMSSYANASDKSSPAASSLMLSPSSSSGASSSSAAAAGATLAPLIAPIALSAAAQAKVKAKKPYLLCLHNATVVTATPGLAQARGTDQMNAVLELRAHSVLVDARGVIESVLPDAEMRAFVADVVACGTVIERQLECNGNVVMAGLVDAHTHAVFGGDRSHEMAAKLAGESYESITSRGGGIYFTVEATRAATEDELASSLRRRLDAMLVQGTTTVEVKSGYGLDVRTEAKMLRVVHTLAATHPIGVVSTFCGAHAPPRGVDAETATRAVIERMIPEVVRGRQARTMAPTLCDVFCDRGFFSAEQAERILETGKAAGMAPAFHGDELSDQGCGELAARVGALSVAHLEHLSDAGIAAMARAGTVALLLPTTAFLLRLAPPPARALIDAGVGVALGSDFNPNAPTLSMPLVMNMAAVQCRLSMEEVLVAATLNSAAALGVAKRVGTVEAGKRADLLLLSTPTWQHLVYLGMGGLGAAPTGANLGGTVSTDGGPLIGEVFVGGVSVACNGRVRPIANPLSWRTPLAHRHGSAGPLQRVQSPSTTIPLGLPDLSFLALGLPLDPLPPAPAGVGARNALCCDAPLPHAPRRRPTAPPADDCRLAVANALRYFPPHLHALLGAEFLRELRVRGHIYMYRFRPQHAGADVPAMRAWPIRAYPARTRSCAAIMFMIMNNLDPAVAQFPCDLITYGSNGSVFQNWGQFWLAMRAFATMSDSQTAVLYSGHLLGVFPSSRAAPRLIVTNGMVVPNYSAKSDLERLYLLGCSMYGNMTAGSFCYIGSAGIVHGTTMTLLNAARRYVEPSGAMAGHVFVSAGLGGMSSAQGKASVICGAIGVIAEVDESALEKRVAQGWITERIDSLGALIDRVRELRAAGAGGHAIGYLGNVVELWERLADEADRSGELLVEIGSDQTSCHNAYGGGYTPVSLSCADACTMLIDEPDTFAERVRESLRRHVAAINRLCERGMRFFDYGNSFMLEAGRAGASIFADNSDASSSSSSSSSDGRQKFRYPSYVEEFMGDVFSLGFGPFRWVCLSNSAADLARSDQIAIEVVADLLGKAKSGSPRAACLEDNLRWIREAGAHNLVVGSQARILYSDEQGRVNIALAFNDAITSGDITAPIVISRDHHDVSGTDSPFRETSNIADGSKFCADMAVQNFVGDAFRGATWVALHNGGGTGFGEAINGGFGLVLDGTDDAAMRARSMLHWDVYNGITRRAWAGNSLARETIVEEMERNPLFVPTVAHVADDDVLDEIFAHEPDE